MVKQGGGETLNDANLGAEAEGEQHQEEESGPEGRPGDLGEHICHHDEGEPGPLGRVVQLLHQRAVPQIVQRMLSSKVTLNLLWDLEPCLLGVASNCQLVFLFWNVLDKSIMELT